MSLTFALVGNQNCGKSTLFNYLTGSNQHVGNFPGVTVQKKEGRLLTNKDVTVIDLPGIYSLSPYTSEEIVTRDLLLRSKPDIIINVIDATNIERSLYLSLQLIELNTPMIMALNMMDELTASGGSIDIKKIEDRLTVPVVPITANSGAGVDELLSRALKTAHDKKMPERLDFCSGVTHMAIHSIAHLIEAKVRSKGLPLRFSATKLIEGDEPLVKELELTANELDIIDHVTKDLEIALDTDKEAALADMRYTYIEELCSYAVHKPQETIAQMRSVKIDHYLTHKYFAIPIFLLTIFTIFWLTFDVIGAALSDWLEIGISSVTEAADLGLTAIGLSAPIHSLIIDGIFTGVGSVLSFLPTIVTLFFFLSMLEDSGYMARVAFIMDKHDTIGIDAVAMCVNDVVCAGGEPLFFLDYIACGKNYPEKIATIVGGVAEGCRQSECALIGGETAEHPGLMPVDEYDVAGFAVGVVDRKDLITGENIKPGDTLIGIASSGVHSNGFSLVRSVFTITEESLNTYYESLGKTLGEALLAPTKIYVKTMKSIKNAGVRVKGCSHITGGGFYENIPRMLPDGVRAVVKKDSYEVPPIFKMLAEDGNIEEHMMYNTFNMGIGLVLAVDPADVDTVMAAVKAAGETPYVIGSIEAGEKGVTLC